MKKFILVLFFLTSLSFQYAYSQWVQSHTGYANQLSKVRAVTSTKVIISGYTQIYTRTTDAGANWNVGFLDIPRNDFEFVDSTTGYLAKGGFTGFGEGLFKTTDGGITWPTTVSTGVGDTIDEVSFVTPMIGWVGGASGLLKKTTDGGSTWVSQTVPTINLGNVITINHSDWNFGNFSFVSENIGWVHTTVSEGVAAGAGTVFKTTDGGATWTYPYDFYLGLSIGTVENIYFADENNGWARGGSKVAGNPTVFYSKILRTSNGGTSWDTVTVVASEENFASFSDIQSSNANTVYLAGSNPHGLGTIYKSTNAGITWNPMTISASDSDQIRDIDVHLSTGWAVGGSSMGGFGRGYILKLVGTTWVKESMENTPGDFMLLQNYPNPFNPSTAIGFSLLGVSNVTLKVYNTFGQEVETLINSEKMGAGVHQLEWNAAGVPSGMYFYRLQTGKFSQTKKMLLLK